LRCIDHALGATQGSAHEAQLAARLAIEIVPVAFLGPFHHAVPTLRACIDIIAPAVIRTRQRAGIEALRRAGLPRERPAVADLVTRNHAITTQRAAGQDDHAIGIARELATREGLHRRALEVGAGKPTNVAAIAGLTNVDDAIAAVRAASVVCVIRVKRARVDGLATHRRRRVGGRARRLVLAEFVSRHFVRVGYIDAATDHPAQSGQPRATHEQA
jgi:hypothetical protein